jgi:hypothetical protein
MYIYVFRFFIGFVAYFALMFPYTYHTIISKEPIDKFRSRNIKRIANEIQDNGKIAIIGKRNLSGSINATVVSIAAAFMISIFDIYPALTAYVLALWVFAIYIMIKNYYTLIIATDKAIIIYKLTIGTYDVHKFDDMESINLKNLYDHIELCINGVQVTMFVGIANGDILLKYALDQIKKIRGDAHE